LRVSLTLSKRECADHNLLYRLDQSFTHCQRERQATPLSKLAVISLQWHYQEVNHHMCVRRVIRLYVCDEQAHTIHSHTHTHIYSEAAVVVSSSPPELFLCCSTHSFSVAHSHSHSLLLTHSHSHSLFAHSLSLSACSLTLTLSLLPTHPWSICVSMCLYVSLSLYSIV
jgi:hypothetical protein